MNTPEFVSRFLQDTIYYRTHPIIRNACPLGKALRNSKSKLQKDFECYLRSKGILLVDYASFFTCQGAKYIQTLEAISEKYPDKQFVMWCDRDLSYRSNTKWLYLADIRGSFNRSRQIRHFEILRNYLYPSTPNRGCEECSPPNDKPPFHICTFCSKILCEECTLKNTYEYKGFSYIKCTCKDLYGNSYIIPLSGF